MTSILSPPKIFTLQFSEMLPNLKPIHFSLSPPLPLLPPQLPNSPNSQPFPCIKQCCKISRRQLAVFGNSSLLLLLSSHIIQPVSKARAEEDFQDSIQSNQQEEGVSDALQKTNEKNEQEETVSGTLQETRDKNRQEETASDTSQENIDKNQSEESVSDSGSNCDGKTITKKAFLEISIDGEPAGRIVIGLYGKDVPAGATRFSNLASGAAGISYRKKEFVRIMPNYVQHGGVRSYGVDVELAKRTGSDLAAETLTDEWTRQYENCPGTKNLTGTVSIIVRDPSKPPPKLKLVARKGKLEIDQEEVGTNPNGTEFVIAVKDSPELDVSALAIGRVLEGMEVVQRIGQVKTVQENTSSPYFRVAKLIGDKRAVVAERGFNRPYSKVLVTNCGLIN